MKNLIVFMIGLIAFTTIAEPLFYAPLDGTADAEIAGGSKVARIYGKINYVDGIKGKAAVVGGKEDRIIFSATKNFNIEKGSCSFWMQPQNWIPNTNNFVFFVSFMAAHDNTSSYIASYKTCKTTNLTLMVRNRATKKSIPLNIDIALWQKMQWHNIVLAWNHETITYYLDGEKWFSIPLIELPKDWKDIILGAPFPSWIMIEDEKTAIDELIILDECLSSAKVADKYNDMIKTLRTVQHKKDVPLEDRTAFKEMKNFRQSNDLALAANGAWIIASSFGDYTKHYGDNLIDGKLETVWEPMENEYPVYLELRWEHPIKINTLAFVSQSGANVETASVLSWNRQTSEWRKIKDLSQDEIKAGKVKFSETTADRLRFVIGKAKGKVTLSELQAYGPPQIIPGLVEHYWDAWYIWHPEPNRTYTVQPRYFRRSFDIEDMFFVTAFLQVRSNDYYRIWINGAEVCSGSIAIKPFDVTKLLRKGTNVIAAEARLSKIPQEWGWGEFLAELSINYKNNSLRIGTGSEWKSSDSNPAAWNNVGFDDSDWKKVYCYTRPPDGPWGKIDYHSTSCREAMKIANVKIDPSVHRPGDMLDIDITIDAEKPIKGNYFLVAGLSTPGSKKHGNYVLSKDVMTLQPDNNAHGKYAVSTKLPLPPYTPSGKLLLTLKMFNAENGFEVDLKGIDDGVAGQFQVESRTSDFQGRGNARVAYTNGQASFVIDEKVTTPLFLRYLNPNSFDLERLYNLDKYSGIKIHYFKIYGSKKVIGIDKGDKEDALLNLDQKITALLSHSPDVYLILGVDLRPSHEWLMQNPRERLIDAFGGEPGVISFASKKYELECRDFVKSMIDFLKQKPYWNHIVGLQPWTCGIPDSAMGGTDKNLWQTDRTKLTTGDFNPQAIQLFRDFLREKYKNNVDDLKKAWRKNDVTFDNAFPIIGEITAEGKDGGVFRDPTEGMMTFDYAEFLPTIYGNFVRRISRFAKEQTNWEKMIFQHYGYVVEHMRAANTPAGQFNNNNFNLPEFLNDPAIDGYVGAYDYGNRLAGTPAVAYFPWSSFKLHGRMYLPDDDQRYYVAAPKTYGRCRSIRESRAIMQRNIGSDITRNFGSWFADMSTGKHRSAVSWTGEKEIAQMLGEMNGIYKKAIETGYKSASEIAVIFNFDSLKYLDVFYGATLNNNLVKWMYYSEFFKIGSPFDVYMFSDLKHPDFRKDYKLYVMMNPYCLSSDDMKVIDSLKKDGKTILWLYAPGYVDSERGLVTDNISSITGIKTEKIPGKEKMKASLAESSHELARGLKSGHVFSSAGFSQKDSAKLHPTEFGPCFRIVDDKADIIARFSDGKGAVAARDFGAWKSIYSVVPRLDVEFLRNVCRWAGVHVYTDSPIVFDANQNFIVLHNGYNGARNINLRFPHKTDVVDAISGKKLGDSINNLIIPMEECSTSILSIK